jgi:hypothetical protein
MPREELCVLAAAAISRTTALLMPREKLCDLATIAVFQQRGGSAAKLVSVLDYSILRQN